MKYKFYCDYFYVPEDIFILGFCGNRWHLDIYLPLLIISIGWWLVDDEPI